MKITTFDRNISGGFAGTTRFADGEEGANGKSISRSAGKQHPAGLQNLPALTNATNRYA